MLPIMNLTTEISHYASPEEGEGRAAGAAAPRRRKCLMQKALARQPALLHTEVLCVPLGGSYFRKPQFVRPSAGRRVEEKPPPLAGLCIVCSRSGVVLEAHAACKSGVPEAMA